MGGAEFACANQRLPCGDEVIKRVHSVRFTL